VFQALKLWITVIMSTKDYVEDEDPMALEIIAKAVP
jgi:hypothetical protein